ncbi:GNAT family N-acetyltransferase [Oenococcus sicerae]|uniref:GNAT family N-acetyltransferase n=1 Tax=Oenococcus sicerae TaxID=2203724 RepID=UPI0039EC1256
MNEIIQPLSQKNALIIADDWHYSGQYAFYDMTADPEDYQEIINPVLRRDAYYEFLDHQQKLLGFFVIEPIDGNKGTYEIGLGLAPSLTGHGLGKNFLGHIISYAITHFSVKKIILDVAEFNIRAQKLYRSIGFKQARQYEQETNNSTYTFIEMTKDF